MNEEERPESGGGGPEGPRGDAAQPEGPRGDAPQPETPRPDAASAGGQPPGDRPGAFDPDRRPRRRGRRGRGGGAGGGAPRFAQPFRPGGPPRPAVPPTPQGGDDDQHSQAREIAAYERREAQQQRRTQFRPSSWGQRPSIGGPPRGPMGGFGRGPMSGPPRNPMGAGRPPMGGMRGPMRGGRGPGRYAGYQEQVRRVTAGPRTHAPSHDAGEPIAGPHAVLEAIRSGRVIRKLYVSQDRSTRTGTVNDLIAEAQQKRIFVNYVDKIDVARMSPVENHQGVVAIVEGRSGVDLDELLLHLDTIAEPPLVLVIDSLQDPQNFGVLLRTAEGAGCDGVVIPRHRAVGLTPAVAKTSAGASEHLLIADVANLRQAIDALKEKGVWVVGADETGELLYDEVDYRGPTAVVIGGEGEGIRRLVLEGCDQVVRIPMAGKVASLNAAAAGTVILYEALRQRTRDVAPPDTQTPRPVAAVPPEAVDEGEEPDEAEPVIVESDEAEIWGTAESGDATADQETVVAADAEDEPTPPAEAAVDVDLPETTAAEDDPHSAGEEPAPAPRKRAARKSTSRAKKKKEE